MKCRNEKRLLLSAWKTYWTAPESLEPRTHAQATMGLAFHLRLQLVVLRLLLQQLCAALFQRDLGPAAGEDIKTCEASYILTSFSR